MGRDGRREVVTRLLRGSDLTQGFEGSGHLAGRLGMETLAILHQPSDGRFVLVAEFQGLLVGAIATNISGRTMHIAYISRNRAVGDRVELQVGKPLLLAAEALGRTMGVQDVTLEAVDEPGVLAFSLRAGFRESGAPFDEPGWGRLHPMRKTLTSEP